MQLESKLNELNTLVDTLQSADVSIDLSIKTYEKIVKLSEKTLLELQKNEDKVAILNTKATNLINSQPT